MQGNTIHITALTAADRLHRAIAMASKAADDGRGYILSRPFKRDGMYCVDLTLDAVQVSK